MMRSTRLQEAAPSWNSLKRRIVEPSAASARAVVEASSVATWRRSTAVVGKPRMKSTLVARQRSSTSGAQECPSPRIRISTRGQWLRISRISRRRCAAISRPLGRLAGRSTAVTKRPAPSKTTIGWTP